MATLIRTKSAVCVDAGVRYWDAVPGDESSGLGARGWGDERMGCFAWILFSQDAPLAFCRNKIGGSRLIESWLGNSAVPFLILRLLLPGGDGPVGHFEARKCYVAGLVLTHHALGEAFNLVF